MLQGSLLLRGCLQQGQQGSSLTALLLCSAAQMMVEVVKQSRWCRKPTMEEFSAIVAPLGAPLLPHSRLHTALLCRAPFM